MFEVTVESHSQTPAGQRDVEYVERKGLGHPDTLCDAVMEAICVALSEAYLSATGRVLHHNIDKGLLVAGQTTPRLGGGQVDLPMRLVVGDRATSLCDGRRIAVGEIVQETTRRWFREHLRFVDPAQHVVIQNELRPGSSELTGIFAESVGGCYPANDTSLAVGFAPLTETERLVLDAEHFLNSSEFKARFPAAGEDVKVMGVRRGRKLYLTVALAVVDRFIDSPQRYYATKHAVREELLQRLQSRLETLDSIELALNALDDEQKGIEGMYLTVLGTSAESGDGGEVGRGNRVNGLISLCRPMTLEAAAGKNPVSHVGKVYNVLAHQIAQRIARSVSGVTEVYVWLCSQIGRPINEPWFASAQVALTPGLQLADVEQPVRGIVQQELAAVGSFTLRLAHGEFPVC